MKLLDLWRSTREVKDEGVKVVDEMWTHVKRNAKVFSTQVFMAFLFSTKGIYVVFSRDRGE